MNEKLKDLKEQVAFLTAARLASIQHAKKFKTQASSEGLENIADDFFAGAKWAFEQQQAQPGVKEATQQAF